MNQFSILLFCAIFVSNILQISTEIIKNKIELLEIDDQNFINKKEPVSGIGFIETFNGTRESKPSEWPWHVALYRKINNKNSNYFCGASLISDQHLLTAAHCFKYYEIFDQISDYHAILGVYNLSNNNEDSRMYRNFSSIEIHEEFKLLINDSLSNADIAIIKMNKKVKFSDLIKPVRLPSLNMQKTALIGTIVGYGATNGSEKLTNILQKGELKIINIDECQKKERAYTGILSSRSFCAGETDATPCKGDSGGGIFVKNNRTGEFEIVGIASIRLTKIESCDPNDYAIFVNVSKFFDWIWSNSKFHTGGTSKNPTKIIILTIFLLFLTQKSFSLRLDCNFVNFFWATLSHTYSCDATIEKCVNDDDDTCESNRPEVNAIYGLHEENERNKLRQSDETVHGLLIVHQRHVTKFPRNIEGYFPNLLGIDMEGCGLTTISARDLAPFKNLRQISLEDNKITELASNLFHHNPNLRRIDLEGNNIIHIGLDIFRHLNQLEIVYLRYNPCTNDNSLALNRAEMKVLEWEIQVECPATLNMLSHALVGSKTFKETFERLSEEYFGIVREEMMEQIKDLKKQFENLKKNSRIR
ncbi:hypothetical protein PVAND_017226 [Polypedilum vanderplanki]|uniref:Peptidase S1 domain-containing protein n=1 Tax=Polypedilum vanderplanki TaxID=319348 RepID=A0A9J6BI04_POLVA|nr:hypothetical protein PVAND_017226 [Polypedilum vanderplanki]